MKALPFLLQLLPVCLLGQNYIDYHRIANRAEVHIVNGNLESAIMDYDSAFSAFENPFGRDIYNAAVCATKLGRTEKAFEYFQMLARKGVDLKTYKLRVFKPLRKSPAWKPFIRNTSDSLPVVRSQWNDELREELETLGKLDQEFRKKRGSYAVYGDTIAAQDSIVMVRMREVLKEFGYPDENLLGLKDPRIDSYWAHYIIVRHHYQNKNFDLSGTLLESVRAGKLSPRVFAELEDKKSNTLERRTHYGTIAFFIIQGKEMEAYVDEEKIDLARREVGLESFSELKQKVKFERKNKEFSFWLAEAVVYFRGISIAEWERIQSQREKQSENPPSE